MISDLLRCHPERGWWSGGQSKDLLGTIEHRKKILRLPARPPTHAQDDTLLHLSLYRRSRRSPAQDDTQVHSTRVHTVIWLGISVLFATLANAAPPAVHELSQRISRAPLEAARL